MHAVLHHLSVHALLYGSCWNACQCFEPTGPNVLNYAPCVAGSPEDLQRVYYYWAIQQDPAGFVGVDGKQYPPRWQLREMLVRGMHALIG